MVLFWCVPGELPEPAGEVGKGRGGAPAFARAVAVFGRFSAAFRTARGAGSEGKRTGPPQKNPIPKNSLKFLEEKHFASDRDFRECALENQTRIGVPLFGPSP